MGHKQRLKKIAGHYFACLPFEVDMRWSGIMAFSADKKPIKEQTSDHTWLVARLNGMGVALASQLGEEIAEKLC